MSKNNEEISRSGFLHIVALSMSISALVVSIAAINKADGELLVRDKTSAVSEDSLESASAQEEKVASDQLVSSARKRAVERLELMRQQASNNPTLSSPSNGGAASSGLPERSAQPGDAHGEDSKKGENITSQIDLSQLSDRGSYLDYGGTRVVKIGYKDQGGRKSPRETMQDRKNFAQKIISQGEKFSFVYPAKGEEKARVVVFSDPTCPYCQKLHRDIERIQEAGVTLHYMMFPRALARGYNDPTAQRVLSSLEYAWCSEDPSGALDDVYANGVNGYAASSCFAEEQGRVPFPYAEHFFMVNLAGISATPVTITEDGREIQGYRDFPYYIDQIGL